MPLYKTITINSTTNLLIWKIEEPYEILLEGIELTENCKERLSHMKSEIHRRGFLSVRQLLKAAGYKSSDLFYDNNGKPHLKDGTHISITHSFIFSGIIISSNIGVGIDIEKQRDKIQKIAHKFVGYEWNYLSNERLTEKLSVIWCAKESMYKDFATKGMSFKKHTKVIPFDLEEGKTVAWVFYRGTVQKYKVHYFPVDGFMCAYALKSKV
ncbi:4'-phosphopantetheinyl transferase family protein [Leptobacterium sp. I13]|uniref:4'-phosphopantetheinyl transferase family protein n=1 Tax=Leptobacterium meishanense TaxID=3128904 RepID=UPI0030EED6C8